MGDAFTICSIEKLLAWLLAEERQGQIFGIRKELFYEPAQDDPFKITRYGRVLDTPLGVAAGPHTQLAQNIISAYLTGARYIELKTVQTLDELKVTKPCIDMTDEGYNCEWSQELKLQESFDQYLNAWILLHILMDKYGERSADHPGFIFNMSVGYNYAGILSANVQRFLDKMQDCAEEKSEKLKALAKIYPRVKDLDIPDQISNNITLSTMHGCPPGEIEKIAIYLIEKRGLHTTLKLNPTLLGPERLRTILKAELGFEVQVPDESFEHDLKYGDGIALIRSLQHKALVAGVEFNLKLTNTLETLNQFQNLPKNEKRVYLSGRALHPISVNLAYRLQEAFKGGLDISFSAGVDCFNVADVLACRIWPVTVCSDILKPGGYGRLNQYLEEIRQAFLVNNSHDLQTYIKALAGEKDPLRAGLQNLKAYAARVTDNLAYHKKSFYFENIKTRRELTTFDCVQAPCVTTCPAGQDVPRYMYHTARGEYEKAFEVILETNPFPRLQGMVCDHLCQFKCTRLNYDNPLLIREIKRFIAQAKPSSTGQKPAAANGMKVAIIGSGPSGLTCAYFMALAGFKVDIYERQSRAGGMAAWEIPVFRLDERSLQKDIEAILGLDVKIHYGQTIDRQRFQELQKAYPYIYISVGAQKALGLGIQGADAARGVMDHLSFLSAVRQNKTVGLGRKVVVVGGGNSAIDAARTAKRLVGPEGEVSILYRRTRKEMPADAGEVQAALDEGIRLQELTAPECLLIENERVKSFECFRMTLGEKDQSGRLRPIKIEGSQFTIEAHSVIVAIGQQVQLDFFPENQLRIDPETQETQIRNVFAGGDAVRGAATLIRAIGDGKRAAEAIKQRAWPSPQTPNKASREVNIGDLQIRQARRVYGVQTPEIALDQRQGFDLVTRTLEPDKAQKEAERCLQCDLFCNICTTVCPNRANVSYIMEPGTWTVQRAIQAEGSIRLEDLETIRIHQPYQIIHIGDFCNACGNCATFCPTSGAPYRIKPKFYVSESVFAAEQTGFWLKENVLKAKTNGVLEILTAGLVGLGYESKDIQATLDPQTLSIMAIRFKSDKIHQVELKHMLEMSLLFTALKDFYLFKS
jgi:putative selenate reductase